MNFCCSAQFAGLLCEEQGSDADNVKYCGYCKYHHSKLVSVPRLLFVLKLILTTQFKVSGGVSMSKILESGVPQFAVTKLFAVIHVFFIIVKLQ